MEKEEYKELIEKWSAIYSKKIGDLFTLEELKQQAWLGILEAERNIRKTAVDNVNAYLTKGIKNHITIMLLREIKNKTSTARIVLTDTDNPESIISPKEIIEVLKLRIEKIPHATFVLDHMDSGSVRDISEIAQREGIPLSKSTVHNKIVLIRKELGKILSL